MDAVVCNHCGRELTDETWYGFLRASGRKTCNPCWTSAVGQWARNSPAKRLIISARKRARAAGLEFTITERDIHIPDVCPILGVRLVPMGGRRDSKDNSPSLDRIDNARGYTPDNVQVISYQANRLKNSATIEQVRALLHYMESHR